MRIHRNLHNARVGGPQWVETARGRVQQYLESITLVNVTTRIQPAGARKCEESGVRSVCAYFDGTAAAFADSLPQDGWRRVAYDPRKDGKAFSWTSEGDRDTLHPWNTADAAQMRADGSTWVLNPQYNP